MMAQMTAAAARTRTVNGKLISIKDLGYSDIGLDDNWQLCGHRGSQGYTYHDPVSGAPIVNPAVFPDFKAMTDHAHSLGLTAGWCASMRHACVRWLVSALPPASSSTFLPFFFFPPLHADGNNCICSDKCSTDACYSADVNATIAYGFDSTKVRGCCGCAQHCQLCA
jgi:hypothetical protein